MKKITFLFLLFSVLSITETYAQSDFYTCIPSDGSTSGNARAPHGRFRYQRGVVLIKATEMAASGIVNNDVINSIAFNYLVAQDVITNGTMTLYLQNTADVTNLKSLTWATTGMTTVSNGAVIVPNTVGNAIYNFSGGSPFTYTGGGVYVAFDYQNAANPLPTTFVTVDCNSTGLASGYKGAQSDTAIPTTIAASSFRPVILLGKLVTCARPNNLGFNTPTLNSAILTYNVTAGGSVDLEYGPYGYTQGTGGTSVLSITSPYTLTGLSPSSTYDYYVRKNCGGGTYSTWAGPYPFHTLFEPANPTYTTSFEQEDFPYIGWSLISGTPPGNDWQFGYFGPPSVTNTLTQDGNTSVYSLSGITATAANNWIISRGINLTAGSTTTISFYTRNYQAATSTGTSSYNVTVGTGQTIVAQATTVATEVNNAVLTWVQKTYTYTPPSTGVYYFGIQNVSPANAVGQQALFLDNLSVSEVLSTRDFLLSKISVLPNPAKDVITISNDVNAIVSTVEMLDLNGRVVKTQKINAIQGQVSIGDLSTGVYMMKIATDQGTVTKKIVKE